MKKPQGALLAVVISLIAVSGCVVGPHFSQMGPDTYAVETGQPHHGRQAASAFCAQMGRHVLVTNMQDRLDGATTVFRCLYANDPEYRRPSYRSPPTVTIENR